MIYHDIFWRLLEVDKNQESTSINITGNPPLPRNPEFN